jgi:hypothetical protein
LQFELLINGAARSLVGATVNMKLARGLVFSTTTGEIVITDAAGGKFQIAQQIIALPAKTYSYELEFIFSDQTRKVYVKGTWKITD